MGEFGQIMLEVPPIISKTYEYPPIISEMRGP